MIKSRVSMTVLKNELLTIRLIILCHDQLSNKVVKTTLLYFELFLIYLSSSMLTGSSHLLPIGRQGYNLFIYLFLFLDLDVSRDTCISLFLCLQHSLESIVLDTMSK